MIKLQLISLSLLIFLAKSLSNVFPPRIPPILPILMTPSVPNIFDIINGSDKRVVGYKIDWEVSDVTGQEPNTNKEIGNIYAVTEYYDIVNRRGRLDIRTGNFANVVNGTFIYDEITGETFHINSGTCNSGNINDKPEFLKVLLGDFWTSSFTVDRQILGPSVYLRALFINKDKVTFNTNWKNGVDRRYFKGNSWNAPVKNNIMAWVFTDPLSPNPYGFKNSAIPIWVGVGGTVNNVFKRSKGYEAAQFMPYLNTTNNIINIPLGFGCVRSPSAIAKTPKPPQMSSGFSYDMRMEIVMNSGNFTKGTETNPRVIVDNGRLTYDDFSKLMAWRYDGFNVSGSITNKSVYYDDMTVDTSNNDVIINGGPLTAAELKNPSRTVWDLRANIVYVIDDMYGGCAIKKKLTNDFLVAISFKNGYDVKNAYRLPINTPEIIQNAGFVYMGEFTERGIPAIVYEKKTTKILGYGKSSVNRTVVFTHYYRKDNYSNYNIKNDMILRIDIAILVPNIAVKGVVVDTKVWSVTINVNEFTIKIQDLDIWSQVKQNLFNIKNCFLANGQSKWFQLGFPITTEQYIKLFQQANTIDKQILNYLYSDVDLKIAPTRIPTSLIGWSSNTLYFSGLILERAPFSFDFQNISIGNQRLKTISNSFIVANPQQCSGRCIDLGNGCNYYSICANSQCLLGKPSLDVRVKPEMVKATNCTTYQKIIRENGYNLPTMNSLLGKIRNRTIAQQKTGPKLPIRPISLPLYSVNSTLGLNIIQLTAVQFKAGFNLGQVNTLDGTPVLNDNRYKLKPVTHFKISIGDKRLTLVIANSYTKCRQRCDDYFNNTCHSFSYCTKNQECILSTFHAEEMIDLTMNNTFETNPDCSLSYRYYVSEYTKSKGLEVPKTATKQLQVSNLEECALQCSQNYQKNKDFKCKSFGLCAVGEGPPIQYNCFLHTIHYFNNSYHEKLNLSLDRNFVHCGHYSRNFVSDFDVKDKMKYAVIDGKQRIKMSGLTVEQCARECVETKSKRKCLGFSYCQNQMIDSLTTKPLCVLSPTNDQNNTIHYQKDTNCQIYFNGGLRFRLMLTQNPKQSSTTDSKRYSTAAGAAVGIFMLLLGTSLTVIGIIVYNKRKAALNNHS